MKTKARKSKKTQSPGAPATVQAPRGPLWLPRWLLVALCIAVVAGVSFAVFELVLPGRIPPELVGRWRVVGGPTDGMTLEFRRNGTMLGKATIDGKDGVIEGTAEVTDNTLRTTTTNPFTGKGETGRQTIVTLTETDLVTEDARGNQVKMVRVP
jgi:uncharacterized protein (TIGR03066 family)